LMQLLETGDPIYAKLINQEYLAFIRQKAIYDQVRFIDATGQEICRVNFNRGNPQIVSKSDLQSKKNRYYFKDTFSLAAGQIFVSPFDLNIEKGQIETPLKPMIRFGTPIFDTSGRKRGIIVLNFLGRTLLDAIDKVAKLSPGATMLLNADGYWLHGEKSENRWGFMYEDKKARRFQATYPSVWKRISTADSTQLHSGRGVFTSVNIRPLFEGIKSSTGAGRAFEQSKPHSCIKRMPKWHKRQEPYSFREI